LAHHIFRSIERKIKKENETKEKGNKKEKRKKRIEVKVVTSIN
jgi:hypothetical protein